jgi:hypothetical protein
MGKPTGLAFATFVALFLSVANGAPYPSSAAITGIVWADAATVVHQADGSDTWPITWADDGQQYTAYGDGWGFDPKVPAKLSLGFCKVSGGPPGAGVNIRSATGEQLGDGRSGKKASGMLMVDGVLYMLVRNADNSGRQSQLAWSADHAATWTWSTWKFAELGYPCFLNFGRNYAGARDGYVYLYSPDTPSAYEETDTLVLARVPKDSIRDRAAYEFLSGPDANGNPTWSSDISQRKAVFTFPGGCNRLDVTYNAPLGRYLLVMRSRAEVGGKNQFSIYDAPEPWGPWTTVFYTESWDIDPGESVHVPAKWISADGRTCHLVFAGSDSFAVRQFTLIAQAQGSPDLSGDAFVDFEDLSLLAKTWLDAAVEADIAPAPGGDGVVNWQDLAALAAHWLSDIGLAAHWALDQIDGAVAPDSAAGLDGTLHGNPAWRPEEGALEFDGIDDYVTTPFVLDPADGPFSIFARIKGGAAGQVVLSQASGANWLMADPAAGMLMTSLSRPGGTRLLPPPLVSQAPIADGVWHRIGIVWDGAERVLYVDGVEVARDAQPSLVGATGPMQIGADKDLTPAGFWSGLIDDVRIYNQKVTP